MHGEQAGSPQFKGFVISHHAHAGASASSHQALGLKAGPPVSCILGHQCDFRVLEEFEVSIYPVRVDGAELLGTLLADDFRNCIAPFSHSWGAVRTHLKKKALIVIIIISSISSTINSMLGFY